MAKKPINKDGETPLYKAVKEMDYNKTRLLILDGANVNAKTLYGYTSLHYAANTGRCIAIIELLISSGADVNCTNEYKETPLHKAAVSGNAKAVELLISNGANINAKDRDDNTPLDRAISLWNKKVIDLLISKGNSTTTNYIDALLHGAVRFGKKGDVLSLIAKGANINAKNKYGSTPLHEVGYINNTDRIELLLSHGADINARNNDGFTPLHYSLAEGPWGCKGDSIESARLLILKGADVNAVNNHGNTPLDLSDSPEIQKLLISYGGKHSARYNICFITTATCLALEKPDDCYELNTFRKFRDGWLKFDKDGKSLIEEYYLIAPDIVNKINSRIDKEKIYKWIWKKYLSKCLEYIEKGKYQEARELYIDMVNVLGYCSKNYGSL